ncbi:hypothetical protein SCHPADRAFT_835333 [Schizopora paradoxa]|uniref:DUF4050 domain-containing protein n=1 Tax=Schizopora paradoxa TaxID=27342 RepID=A0A0H2R9D7_9AGAM|nr:hypothetical protein SCHPADRAFT_835333 [Schizopora paradoxa]
MPEPGLDYFYARRVLWLLPPPIEPRPVSPSPSRIKLEALLNQPGAVESEEVWKAGLKNVWKGLVGGNQLRKRLPLSIVLKILQAGWLRDGTWPEGMVAPSWDPPPAPSTSAAAATSNSQHNTSPIQQHHNNPNMPTLPPIEYPYHYPYPSRVGAAYSGSPSSGDQVQAAEQAALQQHYAMQYGVSSQAYPSSRPPTEPPTSGTPEPTVPPHGHPPYRAQEYDDGFAGLDDPDGDPDDDGELIDDDEIDEPRYVADDGRHEGG